MGKEIVKQESALLAIQGTDVARIIEENVGPGGITPGDLERIKIPSGGGTSWEIPTLEGTESAQEISGVIIAQRNQRVYYAEAYDGSSNPPDCSSRDARMGVGMPGGVCGNCPLSKWDGGQKPACAMRKMILILPEGSILPYIISAPPTSLGPINKYLTRLISHRNPETGMPHPLPYYHLVTRFTLTKTQNSKGVPYSQITPLPGPELSDKEKAAIVAYKESIMPAFDDLQIDQRELEEVEVE